MAYGIRIFSPIIMVELIADFVLSWFFFFPPSPTENKLGFFSMGFSAGTVCFRSTI